MLLGLGENSPMHVFGEIEMSGWIQIVIGWWFGTFFFPYNYWECHHPNFSEGWLNHQPVVLGWSTDQAGSSKAMPAIGYGTCCRPGARGEDSRNDMSNHAWMVH